MEIETITAPPASDSGAAIEQKSSTEAKTPDSGVHKPAEAAVEKKHKLKFGKTEREVSEQELIAMAQKGWAADERFKSAAQKERELKDAYAKADTEFLIKQLKGKNQVEWAKDVLKAELKRRSMTPDEIEAESHKSAIQKLKEERMELEAADRQRKESAKQQYYEQLWDKELADAITKNNLPKNKYVIGRAVKIAGEVLDLTGNDPDWDLVVKEAKRQTSEEIIDLFGQLEDYGMLGNDIPRKISKWLVSQGMSKQQADKEVSKVVRQKEDTEVQTPVDSNEYFAKKREQWMKGG